MRTVPVIHFSINSIRGQLRGCRDAAPLSPKQAKLKQAVQGYSQLGFKFNLDEVASFAGISLRSAYNHKNDILSYWSERSLPPKAVIQFARDRSMELAITGFQSLEEILGVILGINLKVETDTLDNASSLKEVYKFGEHLIKVYRLVCHYKNLQGIPVHSGNKSAKYLLQSKIRLDRLFERSKGYVQGLCAKRWKATDLLKQYVQATIKNYWI